MTVRDFLSAVEGTRKVYVLRPEYSDEGYVKEENLCWPSMIAFSLPARTIEPMKYAP